MSTKHTQDDELEKILDDHAEYYIRQTMKFFQHQGESPALSRNNDGDTAALQALKNRENEIDLAARLNELKHRADDIIGRMYRLDRKYAEQYVKEQAALTQLQGEATEGTDE